MAWGARLGAARAVRRCAGIVALACGALVAPVVTADPLPYRAVSTGDPATEGCAEPGTAGAESDHTIAVDPHGRRVLVATWAQDGERRLGLARSGDGGATWTVIGRPAFTTCDGGSGPFAFAFDPWVSVVGGDVYVSAAVATESPDPAGGYGVAVAHSADGSATWAPPVVVARSIDLLPTDKPTVAADPWFDGRAWVTWTEISLVGGTTITRLARTDDHGRSWSEPTATLPPPGRAEFGGEVLPMPDGALLRITPRFSIQPLAVQDRWIGGGTAIVAQRSTDGGETWSEVVVSRAADSVLRHPDTGADLAFGIPFVVPEVDRDGDRVAITWSESGPPGRVLLATSPDGGRSWRTEEVARTRTAAFRPTVSIRGDRVAVTFDDFRVHRPGDEALGTHTWLRTRRGAGPWSEQPIGPTYDLLGFPPTPATGIPGGDYRGLVHADGAVVAGLVLPSPHAAAGPADLFAWRGAGRAAA